MGDDRHAAFVHQVKGMQEVRFGVRQEAGGAVGAQDEVEPLQNDSRGSEMVADDLFSTGMPSRFSRTCATWFFDSSIAV